MDFEIKSLSKLLYGKGVEDKSDDESLDNQHNVKLHENNPKTEVEVYYPRMTRNTLSIFEYVGVITKLAKYLNSLTNLDKYLSDIEVNQIINPAELAFNLLNDGKFDAVIDRGYELVTFSTLKVKKQWKETISNYFKHQHETVEQEILKPLDLLKDN